MPLMGARGGASVRGFGRFGGPALVPVGYLVVAGGGGGGVGDNGNTGAGGGGAGGLLTNISST